MSVSYRLVIPLIADEHTIPDYSETSTSSGDSMRKPRSASIGNDS